MKIAIIGAGAAGCFCAVNLKRMMPDALVELFEAGRQPLAKVAITGGGRCNLTNSFQNVKSMQQVYPRGHKLMKRLFHQFDNVRLMEWFETEGVRLITQDDQCVFPASQDAMQIVHTLTHGLHQAGVVINCGQRVLSIEESTSMENSLRYRIETADRSSLYDVVVVTSGGSPKQSGLDFLSPLHLTVEPPVPSLFTFRIESPITQLMGVVVEETAVSLAGTKLKAEGPLLITHWGMSGPAILKLSSHAARLLAEQQYKANLIVNWMGGKNEVVVRALLEESLRANPQKQIGSIHLNADHQLKNGTTHAITSRLWHYLLEISGIAPERRCSEVGSKQLNKLIATLTSDNYSIDGQSRFKEEFVTCGGVSLSNVDPGTLECREHPNLYLAGEVLDVDAVTGGFNLQAAWTMGYCVAQAIVNKE